VAKVLVVGGMGYVGVEVVKQLKLKGDDICVLDVVDCDDNSVDSIKVSFTDVQALNQALQDQTFDIIYHIASLPGDTGDPYQMMEVNVTGLLNMLEWARAHPVQRFVLTSSISALEWYPATEFCPPKYMPVDEDHPANPKDMYSSSKRIQEILAITYYHEYGVPTTILRLTAVVGPGGKGGGRGWRQFAEMLNEGKKVQIPHFASKEVCHYVDVRDVARQQITQGEHPNAVGEIFNCCAKEPTRGTEFIEIVEKMVSGIEVECGFAWSMAQGKAISFDMSKAKKLLGYEPKYSLADAIQSIKDWIDVGGLDEEKEEDRQFGTGVKK